MADPALDADSAAFLAQVRAAGAPLEARPLAEARALSRQTMLAGDRRPPPIGRVEQAEIAGTAGPVPARLYYPAPASVGGAALPLVLFFHGGGWIYGDLDSFDNMMRALCAGSGAAMLAADYRLAPEHPFPAGLDDCFDALEWAVQNAARLGVDPARIAVMGDSAGGNLAAAVTLRARAQGGPAIARQILLYPLLALDGEEDAYPSRRAFGNGDHLISRAGLVWAYGHYLRTPAGRASPLVSPLLEADLTGLPPALVLTAGFDPLRDEAHAYAGRLQAAGVAVDYRCFETTIHGFLSMPDWIKAGREGRRQIAAWIAATL